METVAINTSAPPDSDWLVRLKAGYDAGYYRTESSLGQQESFPWQNKRCSDCPYWSSSICRVHAEYRARDAHTCSYFDAANREAANALIHERQWQGYRRWWDWFNSR
jgi:hypothetical protein